MLYYRTHASRVNELPPELVGWESPSADANLNEQVIGEHRVLGITPPFVFAPPKTGWVPLCNGWEVVSEGAFLPFRHLYKKSKFLCRVVLTDDMEWVAPVVLNDNGLRHFPVTYGGVGFKPIFSDKDASALKLAEEIRAAISSNILPDYPIRAEWAAELLGLVYCLSPVSLSLVGLPEKLIDETLQIAGGCHAPSE
jgi:hypothetical protein